MEFYLKEAFQSLKLLEDDFNLTADQGVIDELQSFVADDIEAPAEEEIIDVEADEAEDLQDNYIGKVILECDCCHTRIYKNVADVIIDEDSGLANIEEQCPVCSNAFGFNVIGKIEPFKEGEFDDESEEEADAEVEVEISDDDIDEALREALNADEQRELNGIVYNHLADAAYEAEVDHELDATRSDMEKAQRAFNDDFYFGSVDEDVDVHVDQPEESNDVVVNVDADDELHEDFEDPDKVGVDPDRAVEDDFDLETPGENPVTEIPDKLVVKESMNLREDVEDVRKLVAEYLIDKLDIDFNDNLAIVVASDIPDYNPDWCVEDDSMADRATMAQDEFIDATLDQLFANAPRQESFQEDVEEVQSEDAEKLIDPEEEPVLEESVEETACEQITEDVDHVEVKTDEGAVEVEKEGSKIIVDLDPQSEEGMIEEPQDEMIAPLEPEDINQIENNEEQSAEEVALDDQFGEEELPVEGEDELGFEDFDEESFDEIGESYLHRVYDNVDSFKTTKVVESNNKLVVEGLITFKSGKTKSTTFTFEGFRTTKRGKMIAEGMNNTFSKSNRAFILKGTLNEKNFVSESLTYSYTVKSINESNESEVIRVYGKAVRK